ncbi:hypothetical protein, partial [Brevibacillus borstelensis]|uniref:hypothetical protein n=1 Tax=Brevibacillus borstelensis TaxID=45462 RepID=UPI001FAAD7FA
RLWILPTRLWILRTWLWILRAWFLIRSRLGHLATCWGTFFTGDSCVHRYFIGTDKRGWQEEIHQQSEY